MVSILLKLPFISKRLILLRTVPLTRHHSRLRCENPGHGPFAMKSPLTLALLTFIICIKSVLALPSLIPRQACDSLFCLDGIDWGGLGQAGLDGLTELWNGFQSVPERLPDVPIPANNPGNPNGQRVVDPNINNDIAAPLSTSEECAPANPVSEQIPGSPDSPSCQQATEQLVWPVRCLDNAHKLEIQNRLAEIDSGYLTSVDPSCTEDGGVLFWLAKLTKQQIDDIRLDTAVQLVVRNIPLKFGQYSADSGQTPVTDTSPQRGQLKKREMKLLKQEGADQSLSFLSTPPGKLNPSNSQQSGRYAYLESAGAGVQVYVIESGFHPAGSEYDGRNIDILPAFDVTGDFEENPDAGNPGHYGSCTFSKIGGAQFGVAKNAKMTLVKAKPFVASFVSALVELRLHLHASSLKAQGSFVSGRTVISMAPQFQYELEETKDFTFMVERMAELIGRFTETYGAVVVASSGVKTRPDYAEVFPFPQALAPITGLITVGSVVSATLQQLDGVLQYGQQFPWSGGEPMVNAPGNGDCMGPDGQVLQNVQGANISVATVAGLLAYLLSLPNVLASWSVGKDIPAAAARYLADMSYERFPGLESIWNGLDYDDDARIYLMWRGTPPTKAYQPVKGF